MFENKEFVAFLSVALACLAFAVHNPILFILPIALAFIKKQPALLLPVLTLANLFLIANYIWSASYSIDKVSTTNLLLELAMLLIPCLILFILPYKIPPFSGKNWYTSKAMYKIVGLLIGLSLIFYFSNQTVALFGPLFSLLTGFCLGLWARIVQQEFFVKKS